MDAIFVLLGLLAVAAFLLGPIAFFMAIGHRRRLKRFEQALFDARARIKQLEAEAAAGRAAIVASPPILPPESRFAPQPEPRAAPAAPLEPPVSTLAETPSEPAPEDLAAPSEDPSPPAPTSPPPAAPPSPPRPSLEEALGARWAIWVGAVALGFGALLLVRLSINAGFFGPSVRVTLGLVLGVALLAGGEWLRRAGAEESSGRYPSAPAALTAAGVVAAFGSLLAAYALYGFIGPAVAFVALGLVALASLALAAVHGPALAALGFVGANAAPLIVASDHASPWPFVLYLLIVSVGAYGLARFRRWLWLALTTVAGAAAWIAALALGARNGSSAIEGLDLQHAVEALFALQGVAAAVFLGLLPHVEDNDGEAKLDPVSAGALTLIGAVGLFALGARASFALLDPGWILSAGVFAIALVAVGSRAAPTAPLAALAGLFTLGALAIWPSADPLWPFALYDALVDWRWPPPAAAQAFVGFAAVVALLVSGLSGLRLLNGPKLTIFPAACLAAAAALTPLGALALADARLAEGAASARLAAAAALLAALFAAAASRFRAAQSDNEAVRLGLGALAAAAIASLGAGLVFALDGEALVVALALSALASAYVAVRLDIAALRWCVAGFGVVIGARLALDPQVFGALSTTPIFNGLLLSYGVPALAFGAAAHLMRPRGEDTPLRIADAMTVLFAALLIFFEIRHAANGGSMYARASGLEEQGQMAFAAFGFGFVLNQLDAARANPVFRWAATIAGALGSASALFGLLLVYNPLWTGERLAGGVVINSLLLGYALPALAAAALWRSARRTRPLWYVRAAAAAAVLLAAAYAMLEIRRCFHDYGIGFEVGFGVAELGLDASAALAIALALDAAGMGGPVGARYQRALFAFAALVGLAGSGVVFNPLITDNELGGGSLFNALLAGYLLPAALSAALGGRTGRPAPRVAAILWLFAYVTLETRRLFHGPAFGFRIGFGDAEIYAYSAVWLALGLGLLAYGVVRQSREARYASAFFVVMTTLKVFLYDFASLEGALRAFSFIGLGLALVGIGLVYQKWVFAARPAQTPDR